MQSAGQLVVVVDAWVERGGGWVAAQRWRLAAGARVIGNLVLGAVLAALVLVLLALYLVGRSPSYYRDPDTVSDEQLIEWGEGFVGKANELLTQVLNKEDFAVTITEEEVNGYLASFFRPKVKQALSAKLSDEEWLTLPAELTGLMVHLGEGEVALAARYERSRFRPIVSLTGEFEVTGGGELQFGPTKLRAGWLRVPLSWVPELEELAGRPVSLDSKGIRWERITVSEGQVELAGCYKRSDDGRSPSGGAR